MPRKTRSKRLHVSYLDRIRVDPALLQTRVAAYIKNIRIVVLLVLTIFLLGLANYFQLPRRLNPEIKIPIITVFTLLPGASPEDVESLITIPLENEIKGVQGLDEITSSSTNSVSAITMQFLSNVPVDAAKEDVQSAVDAVTDLPQEAQTPTVRALDFEDVPIWTFAIASSRNDPASLALVSQTLKERLEDVAKVDRVVLVGQQEQEVAIEIIAQKAQDYDINPALLGTAVRSSLQSFPAGSVVSLNNSFSLTIDPISSNLSDIRNLRVSIEDRTVRLSDIAVVALKPKPAPRLAYIANNNSPATRIVTFDVFKTSSANIDEGYKAAKNAVDAFLAPYGNAFNVVSITNTAELIDKQFFDLLGEFRSTILLVFAALLVFLGLRQALISCFTVPLTFLSAFIFMRVTGMSINFLSLFAFLLTLGLLVDDTIVVVSAMTTYYKTGRFTPYHTGILVWRDTIIPIWSTTITTIWSFVPLLLSTGIIGEFIKPIPVVVTVTMISSTAIAVLITLPFMVVLLKPNIAQRVVVTGKILSYIALLTFVSVLSWGNPFFLFIIVLFFALTFVFWKVRLTLYRETNTTIGKNQYLKSTLGQVKRFGGHGIIDLNVISRKYYRLIYRILSSSSARRKVVFAIIIYATVSFLLVPLGLVKNEFFPKADNETIFVTLELPNGTKFEKTLEQNTQFIEQLRHTPFASFVVAQVGTSISLQRGTAQENIGTILYTIHLPDEDKRPVSSIDIAQNLRDKFAHYPGGKVSVIEQSGGPPVGADVQLKLSGNNLAVLEGYADRVVQFINQQPGIINVEKSVKAGTSALVFEPDYTKLTETGVGIETIGLWLRTYASGFSMGEVNLSTQTLEKQEIVLRFTDELPQVSDLSRLLIPTRNGSVPLVTLGTVKTKTNPTVITRKGGKRTLSVSASVTSGYNISDLNRKVENFADTLDLPDGYGWSTGGINEENQKSVQSILQAMVLSFILIMVTMVLQFQSYRQAFIVLIVIPLAVSSVFAIFAITGTPLSFPALIGVLSLFGIVVTNSMFIVDKINLNIREGMEFKEAIADAGASRLEPIVLTKLCTVLGLLPITLSNPLWRGLGGAIISGILLASTIMLLFIPVVYYEVFVPRASR